MRVDLAHLEALLAAVDEGSFDGAAAILRISPSALSQRIKALETTAGQVLLQRTKPVRPTPAGLPYLQAARQIDAVLSQTLAQVDAVAPGPPDVPIAINADSLETWIIPALASIRDVANFHIFRDDQDHTAELLRSGTVLAAVTSLADPIQGCESHRLGVMRYLPVATPDFAARWFPHGLTPPALEKAPTVVFDRKDKMQHRLLHAYGVDPNIPARCYVPSATAFVEAVAQDMGWGLAPEIQIDEALATGSLIHLSDYVDVTLYWQQWKLESPALTVLRRTLADAAAYALRIR